MGTGNCLLVPCLCYREGCSGAQECKAPFDFSVLVCFVPSGRSERRISCRSVIGLLKAVPPGGASTCAPAASCLSVQVNLVMATHLKPRSPLEPPAFAAGQRACASHGHSGFPRRISSSATCAPKPRAEPGPWLRPPCIVGTVLRSGRGSLQPGSLPSRLLQPAGHVLWPGGVPGVSSWLELCHGSFLAPPACDKACRLQAVVPAPNTVAWILHAPGAAATSLPPSTPLPLSLQRPAEARLPLSVTHLPRVANPRKLPWLAGTPTPWPAGRSAPHSSAAPLREAVPSAHTPLLSFVKPPALGELTVEPSDKTNYRRPRSLDCQKVLPTSSSDSIIQSISARPPSHCHEIFGSSRVSPSWEHTPANNCWTLQVISHELPFGPGSWRMRTSFRASATLACKASSSKASS